MLDVLEPFAEFHLIEDPIGVLNLENDLERFIKAISSSDLGSQNFKKIVEKSRKEYENLGTVPLNIHSTSFNSASLINMLTFRD